MLAKEPARRPADGGALLRELTALGAQADAPGQSAADLKPPDADSAAVAAQNLYTVVLAVLDEPTAADNAISTAERARRMSAARQSVATALVDHHATPRWLYDGSLLLTMSLSDSAHDPALQAARCALTVKKLWLTASIAVTTGCGQQPTQDLIGEVADRAARILRDRHLAALDNPRAAALLSSSIWLDELTASLLERRFAIVPVRGAALLHAESSVYEETQPILSNLAPCLGREEELSVLESTLDRCRYERKPQVVLVTSPPGVGKTRLRQEFLSRLRRRSWPRLVGLAVGEVVSANTPGALLGQVVCRLCDIESRSAPKAAWRRLLVCCTELLGVAKSARSAKILGRLCGLQEPGADLTELPATPANQAELTAQLAAAFLDLLSACCARAPVVLVLDDLHWADPLTIELVGRALTGLAGGPLMVLALARPEVTTTHPAIRHWPCQRELRLGSLSRLASERLIRCVLGNDVTATTVARIIDNAAGNTLLLEELIHAERANARAYVPPTVLAILQARMQRLSPAARLRLCQASIFGQRFMPSGLLALSEGPSAKAELDGILLSLQQAEFIDANSSSSHKGQLAYSFRNPLIRDAAYGLVPLDQKQRWHRVAGHYLEQNAETDPAVLAEHFRNSDEKAQAVPYYIRMATDALDAEDMTQASAHARIGLACLPNDNNDAEQRGTILCIQAITAFYQNTELTQSLRLGKAALLLLKPGSVRFCKALYPTVAAASLLGQREALREFVNLYMTTAPQDKAQAAYVEAGGMLHSTTCIGGDRAVSLAILARMESTAADLLEQEPTVKAWLSYSQYRQARILDGDRVSAHKYAKVAAYAALHTGNSRMIGAMQADAALASLELGSPDGEVTALEAMESLRSLEQDTSYGYVAAGLALWLSAQPDKAGKAIELAEEVIVTHKTNLYYSGVSHWALARALRSDVTAAERHARTALSRFDSMPPMRLGVLADLSRLYLSQGRVEEALATALDGCTQLAALGGTGYMDLTLRLALIEAGLRGGDRTGAVGELRSALSTLTERAAQIKNPASRQRFLEHVSENARLRALGRQLLSQEMPFKSPITGTTAAKLEK